jgi:hypothetical protein
MTHEAMFNDIPAPDGFVYVAAPGLHEAHLSPEDESEILTLCGAPAESPVEFETLPHVSKSAQLASVLRTRLQRGQCERPDLPPVSLRSRSLGVARGQAQA